MILLLIVEFKAYFWPLGPILKKKGKQLYVVASSVLVDVEIQTLAKYTQKKSRIRDTKHLSTDADSSNDTTVGWTKNTQKPNFF